MSNGKTRKRRRAFKKTSKKWNLVLKAYNFSCLYCGIPLSDIKNINAAGQTITADHLIPKVKGGTSALFNIATCCYDCNHLKDNKDISIFISPQIFKRLINAINNLEAEFNQIIKNSNKSKNDTDYWEWVQLAEKEREVLQKIINDLSIKYC